MMCDIKRWQSLSMIRVQLRSIYLGSVSLTAPSIDFTTVDAWKSSEFHANCTAFQDAGW